MKLLTSSSAPSVHCYIFAVNAVFIFRQHVRVQKSTYTFIYQLTKTTPMLCCTLGMLFMCSYVIN